MIVALDSNVLAYFGAVARVPSDLEKIAAVQTLLLRLAGNYRLIAAVQALGEYYNVLLKSGSTREEALRRALNARNEFGAIGTSPDTMREALDLATEHKLQIWDAVILVASREAGATVLLSEDMHDGFTWRGLTIIDPFGPKAETALFG